MVELYFLSTLMLRRAQHDIVIVNKRGNQ